MKRQSQADDILDGTLPGHSAVKVGAMEGVTVENQGQKTCDGHVSVSDHSIHQAAGGSAYREIYVQRAEGCIATITRARSSRCSSGGVDERDKQE